MKTFLTIALGLGALLAHGHAVKAGSGSVDTRPRLVVADFRPVRADFRWHGVKGDGKVWTRSFAERLRTHFAACDQIATEEGTTNADFRVMGKVGFGFGEPLSVAIAYQVVSVRAGKVIWDDVLWLEADAFAAKDISAFSVATVDAASSSISERVIANVVPFRITGRMPDDRLVVAGGGGELFVGECMTVFAPNGLETAMGTVQIVEVRGRTGWAQIVEGDAERIPTGARLRRVPLISPWTGGSEKDKLGYDF